MLTNRKQTPFFPIPPQSFPGSLKILNAVGTIEIEFLDGIPNAGKETLWQTYVSLGRIGDKRS